MQYTSLRFVVLAALLAGAVSGQSLPVITAILNSASQDARLSPGCLVDIVGTNLGTDKKNVEVHVGGATIASKYVVTATNTKWTVLIPWNTPTGQTTMDLGLSALFPVTLAQYSPALFSADGTGKGTVSAMGYKQGPTGAPIVPGYPVNDASPAKLGDLLIISATGLGPPDAANEYEAMETPTVAIGGQPTNVMFAPMITDQNTTADCYGPCQPWYYKVMVALSNGLPVLNQSVTISVGGQASPTLTIPISSTPVVNAIVNAASYDAKAPLVPGELASVFGTTFGTNDVFNPAWPTTAAGVSVAFNGINSPLVALVASQGQINLQVPVELPESGPVTARVTTPDGVSADYTVQMASSAPGVFFIPSSLAQRPRVAAVLFNNTAWRVMPDDFAQELNIAGNCKASAVAAGTICGEPARPGDYIQIYVTGLGKAAVNGDPSQGVLATGQVAPASGNPLYKTVYQPTVTIGGAPATIVYSGLAPGFAGLYQINVQIPPTAPTNYAQLVVSMPNGSKDDKTTLAIKQ